LWEVEGFTVPRRDEMEAGLAGEVRNQRLSKPLVVVLDTLFHSCYTVSWVLKRMVLSYSITGTPERSESKDLGFSGRVPRIACGNRWH